MSCTSIIPENKKSTNIILATSSTHVNNINKKKNTKTIHTDPVKNNKHSNSISNNNRSPNRSLS